MIERDEDLPAKAPVASNTTKSACMVNQSWAQLECTQTTEDSFYTHFQRPCEIRIM